MEISFAEHVCEREERWGRTRSSFRPRRENKQPVLLIECSGRTANAWTSNCQGKSARARSEENSGTGGGRHRAIRDGSHALGSARGEIDKLYPHARGTLVYRGKEHQYPTIRPDGMGHERENERMSVPMTHT